jgi:hypothetical protein
VSTQTCWSCTAEGVQAEASADEQLEVILCGGAQPRLAGLGRVIEEVDGLSRPILPRRRQPLAGCSPEIADGILLTDHESGPAGAVDLRERGATAARGDEVRPDVAERDEPAALSEAREPAETPAGDVL